MLLEGLEALKIASVAQEVENTRGPGGIGVAKCMDCNRGTTRCIGSATRGILGGLREY